MIISWQGETKIEIKTKNAVIKTGDTIFINDIELTGAGEYEISGIEVIALAKGIYHFRAEDIPIAYLDGISRELDNHEIEELGNTEILIVPVGKDQFLDNKKAISLIKAIEPKIIIPIGEKASEEFCQQVGGCQESVDSYKITKQQISLMEGQETITLNT